MKRLYTDVMGNKLEKADVMFALQVMGAFKTVTPMALHRPTRWGIGKASNMLTLLSDAGVVTKKNEAGIRSVTLKGAGAVNAALRQLKKGR